VAPAWSYEHTRWRLLRAFAGTVLRCLWPWALWRGLRLEQRVVVGRVLVVALVGTGLGYALLVVVNAGVNVVSMWVLLTGRPFRPQLWMSLLRWGLWPFYSRPRYPVAWGLDACWVIAGLWPLVTPLAFFLLPRTLARVRRLQLLRVAAYSLPAVPVLIALTPAISHVQAIAHNVAHHGGWSWPGFLSVPAAAMDWWAGWPWAMPAVVGAWLVLWWGLAAGRYLKLPHAWIGAALLVVASGLLSVLLTLLLPGAAGGLMFDHQ
jgi:hypothetical protein